MNEIHVCLVSDQHWANMLAILKRRPARVELVCTPEMLKPEISEKLGLSGQAAEDYAEIRSDLKGRGALIGANDLLILPRRAACF